MRHVEIGTYMVIDGQGGTFVNIDSLEEHMNYAKRYVFFCPETGKGVRHLK